MTDQAPRKTIVDRVRERADANRHIQDVLDAALEESFPASDPPSITQPPHTKDDK